MQRELWLKALQAVEPPTDHDDAMTTADLCRLFGSEPTCTRRRIRKLMDTGRATQVTKIVLDSAGRRQRVPAYVLVE